METKQELGSIEFIRQESGEKNGKAWTRYIIGINERKWATFNAELVKDLKQGDYVEISLEKDGQYWQIANIKQVTEKAPVQASNAQNQAVAETIKGILIQRTENANSFEFGKASWRHKIYYETAEELKAKIEALKEIGLYSEDIGEALNDRT